MKGALLELSPATWTPDRYRNASRHELYDMKNEAKKALQYNTRMKLDTACLIWELRLQNIQNELAQRTT